jgi:hypothetical protein
MATETQQVVQNSSTAAAANPATSNTPVATSGAIPTPTPVVAPEGFRQELQQMLQGWQTVIPSGSTIQSSSGNLTQAAVLEQLQEYLGVYTTLDATVTALKQVRTQAKSQLPEARQYLDVLRVAVANAFGPKSPQLVQFGFQPKKPQKGLTATALAVRAAKAAATRKLRGTMSKKQKAPIKTGPMKVSVQPDQQATQGSASQGTTAVSSTPADPAVNAASPPAK